MSNFCIAQTIRIALCVGTGMIRRIRARYRSRCANLTKARSKNPCNKNKRPRLVSEQTVVKNKRGKANIKGKKTRAQPKRKANTVVSYAADVSARGTSGGLFKARRSLNALLSARQKNRKFNEAIKVVKKKHTEQQKNMLRAIAREAYAKLLQVICL